MKSTTQSRKFKSRAVSIAVCAVFILCILLSIGTIFLTKDVFAADGDQDVAGKEVNGIRFVQIAAGEDFAIGLTFDNKLYGWSLKPNNEGFVPTASDSTPSVATDYTLGDYYSSIPTEIPVTYRVGPGMEDDSSDGPRGYEWSNTNNYHATSTDTIKKIAATRTTAAFLTEKGYIYTWGKDAVNQDDTKENVYMVDVNQHAHYLLLRDITGTDANGNQIINWYTPYIINYSYYLDNNNIDSQDSMRYSKPTQNNGFGNTDLAAGEYNYIFKYTKNGTGNTKDTFAYVWGSLMYNNVQTQPFETYNFMKGESGQTPLYGYFNNRRIVKLGTDSNGSSAFANNSFAVAGGYNIGFNVSNYDASGSPVGSNATSLMLRGRNFLTSQYDSANGYINTVSVVDVNETIKNTGGEPTTSTTGSKSTVIYNQNGKNYDVTGGVVGGASLAYVNVNQVWRPTSEETPSINLDRYYGRMSGGTASRVFIGNKESKIDNAHDVALSQIGDTGNYYRSVYNYGVSLGNDVGYGITADGNLYAWGDNFYGQLTSGTTAKHSPTPTQILSGKGSFASVAAGKQLSADNKAMHYTSSLELEVGDNDAVTVTGFSESVKNNENFISGAITTLTENGGGELWVWSNKIPEPKRIVYGDSTASVNKSDRFVAVYSGYGNNIFAITETGKMIRVEYVKPEDGEGYYKQTRYDTFRSAGGTPITNWTVNDENTVMFIPEADPTAENIAGGSHAPDLGSATFYVWTNTADGYSGEGSDKGHVLVNPVTGENGGLTSGAYKTLVSNNNIGDVYRILGVGSDNTAKAGTFLSDNGDVQDFRPVFSYIDGTTETVMTDKQRENMFDFRFVADANGVGINIKPLKSTKNFTIAVDFYIARYNSTTNFSASGSGDNITVTDNALYYDYQKCRIAFSVADTRTVQAFSPFEGENGNGNSKIPLLDPNNGYNKFYSVAVQNVSEGVAQLFEFLNAGENAGNAVKAMTEADKGFPAKSKIVPGDLTYYLGADVGTKYYTDKYQYLFVDRDADRIVVSPTSSGMMQGFGGIGGGAVNGSVTTVSVKNVDTGIPSNSVTLGDLRKKIATDFNNVYGLYNILVAVGNDNTILLSFDYDVLLFEAVAGTGNIEYEENASVSAFKTLSGNTHVKASITANAFAPDYTVNNEGVALFGVSGKTGVEIYNTSDIVAVFANPSLRLYRTIQNPDGGTTEVEISGSNGAANVYEETYNAPIVVGESVTLPLSDYFKTTSSTIAFSYKDSVTKFNEFNAQFVDQTGNGIQTVTLNGSSLTVRPTIARALNITVTVQRFAGTGNTTPFADNNEKIYVTFIFPNIIDFEFGVPQSNDPASGEQIITKTETFSILGAAGTFNAGRPFVTVGGDKISSEVEGHLRNMVKISDVTTSEDKKSAANKLFTIIDVTDTSFTVVPQVSGSGTVQFIATLYNKSRLFSVTLNIAAVTTISDTVTIVDDQYIYVDSIKSSLEKSNTYNGKPYIDLDDYRILYNDFSNPAEENRLNKISNAIYFTDESGAKVERPSFIRNVVFEGLTSGSSPYVRIISNNSPTDADKTFYMHVLLTNAKFTDTNVEETYANAPSGTVIEAVYPVKSGKVRINVSVDINCRDISSSSADGMALTTNGSGTDSSVSFTVTQLLNLIGTEQAGNYTVVIIKSDSTTAQYFGYATSGDDKTIIITPNYNTPKDENNQPIPCELEVSLSNGTDYLVVTFDVTVDGILTTLPVMQGEDGIIGYGNIWLYSFIIVFGVLAIIFVIRFIVYWKKRAQQRAIIKRNQDLIRMRDRMHNKGASATREQVVKTKLKMDDPKYAKMFNEMRKNKEEDSGVILEHSDLAAIADKKSKKKKKKKGGKKTVAELKAELEAKKAAFAAAQGQPVQPVDPFVQDVPMDGGAFDATPDGGAFDATPDGGFDAVTVNDDFGAAQSIDGSEIIFDASDMGDGM